MMYGNQFDRGDYIECMAQDGAQSWQYCDLLPNGCSEEYEAREQLAQELDAILGDGDSWEFDDELPDDNLLEFGSVAEFEHWKNDVLVGESTDSETITSGGQDFELQKKDRKSYEVWQLNADVYVNLKDNSTDAFELVDFDISVSGFIVSTIEVEPVSQIELAFAINNIAEINVDFEQLIGVKILGEKIGYIADMNAFIYIHSSTGEAHGMIVEQSN